MDGYRGTNTGMMVMGARLLDVYIFCIPLIFGPFKQTNIKQLTNRPTNQPTTQKS